MAKGKYKQWLTDDGLTALATWARLGLTDKDIANNMDINVSTLYEWKKRYKELSEALTHAKSIADSIVENSLYKRANGFSYDEVTRENKYNPDTKVYEMITTKIVTRMVIPDTTAQIYWLKNRKQSMWRDKHEVNVIGNVEIKSLRDDIATFGIKDEV